MSTYLATDTDLTAVANAIRAKSNTSSPLTFPDEFVSAIGAIPTGPVAVPPKAINFIDYDGTIVAAYTAAEFAQLTAMPANPAHQGLTAQGWNWTLDDPDPTKMDAHRYAAKYGGLTIGQQYVTSDGKTRIRAIFPKARISPYLGIAVNGTAVIDWGDGSNGDTVTGSSTSTVIFTQHTYATSGEYEISIEVTGTVAITGGKLLCKSSSAAAAENDVYLSAIKRVHIGDHVTLGNSAFSGCKSLEAITIPEEISGMPQSAFEKCYSLKCVVVPSGVTDISGTNAFVSCLTMQNVSLPNVQGISGSSIFRYCETLHGVFLPDKIASFMPNTFRYCYGITSLVIPDGVVSIGGNAFSDCNGLAELRFLTQTPPTVDNSNAFTGLPTDCVIYVPAGKLLAYTTATNYPDPEIYTYVEEAAI